jgi:hypothetical protein
VNDCEEKNNVQVNRGLCNAIDTLMESDEREKEIIVYNKSHDAFARSATCWPSADGDIFDRNHSDNSIAAAPLR